MRSGAVERILPEARDVGRPGYQVTGSLGGADGSDKAAESLADEDDERKANPKIPWTSTPVGRCRHYYLLDLLV